MKSSTAFKKAAEKIFKGDATFSCIAASEAKYGFFYETCPELIAYRSYFMPDGASDNNVEGWYGSIFNAENQLARQLALLFMAELSKDLEK